MDNDTQELEVLEEGKAVTDEGQAVPDEVPTCCAAGTQSARA